MKDNKKRVDGTVETIDIDELTELEKKELQDAGLLDLGKKYDIQLPDPNLLRFYEDLEERSIWIYGIDEDIIEVSKHIISWNKEDKMKNIPVEERKPIKLFLYSYGGDGQACFNLLDTIAMSKTPVYTYNMGISMSAGFLILLAGHKRFGLKNSVALVHSGSGGTSGTYEQTEAQMKDYKHFVKTMHDFILERTQIDTKTWNKNKDKEWYLYSDEQVKYQIINEIITDIDQLY